MTTILADPRTRRFARLVWVLSEKNFQTRYRRTALGMVWVLLQPLLQAAVVTIVFERLIRNVGVEHYGLYVLSGVLPWGLTSRALLAGTTSVVDNTSLLKKVAVSRLVYPLSAIGGTLVVWLASLVILVAATIFAGTIDADLLLLPVAVLLQLLVVLGPCLLAAALYVGIRDVRFIVESGLLVLFYATPVIYPAERLGSLADLLQWNPMTGVLSVYRAAVLDRPVDGGAVTVSVVFGAAVLAVSLVVFHRRSAEFADIA
jgi:ABC-2 type transport system permease protein